MCGATPRRLTASALCSFDKQFLADVTGEAQFAIGKAAGVEKLGATLQALLEAFPELAVLQFVAVSAFNNLTRERVLQRVRDTAPRLLAYSSLWLTRPSVAVLVKADGSVSKLEVTTGVDQGDPLAPFPFAIGLPLQEIRVRIAKLLRDAAAADPARSGLLPQLF